MIWEHPKLFWFLILVFMALVGSFFFYRRKVKFLNLFCDERFQKKFFTENVKQRWFFFFFFRSVVLFLLVLVLAQPQWGFREEKAIQKGVDLFVLVDLSNSMLASDISPSRLERAKRKVRDLIKMTGGDRIGLIGFAGKAALMIPLTQDHEAIDPFLDLLSPDLISIQGTDFPNALQLALKHFKGEASRAVLIFSDGEDHSEALSRVIEELKKEQVTVYTIGIGTLEGGPIPEEGGLKKDEAGKMIVTQLKEGALKQLAEQTGGVYVRSVTGDEDLKAVYKNGIKKDLKESEFKSGTKKVYQERYQLFLFLAVLFFVFELFSFFRRKQKTVFSSGSVLKLFAVFLIFFFYSSVSAFPLDPIDPIRKIFGERSYQKKDYNGSKEQFSEILKKNPQDYDAAYNLGHSFYRSGDFSNAIDSFEKSLGTNNSKLQADALHNLGNSYYRLKDYQNAISSYEKSLKLRPEDPETKANLEFVKKKLQDKKNQEKKEQEKQKPESQESQNSPQKQEQKNPDQNEKQNQNQDQKQEKNQEQKSQNDQQKEQQKEQDKEENKNPEKKPSDSKQEAQEEKGEKEQRDKQKESEKSGGEREEVGANQKPSNKEMDRLLEGIQENPEKVFRQQIQKQVGRGGQKEKDW